MEVVLVWHVHARVGSKQVWKGDIEFSFKHIPAMEVVLVWHVHARVGTGLCAPLPLSQSRWQEGGCTGAFMTRVC